MSWGFWIWLSVITVCVTVIGVWVLDDWFKRRAE
jgi:hypothetical protein